MANRYYGKECKSLKTQPCANCGETENIEIHHIVPLLLGGTNRRSNLVPLCHACHMAAHKGRHINEYRNKPKAGGRPRLDFKGDDIAKYVYCEISLSEFKRIAGCGEHTKPKDLPQFQKWLKEHGIIKCYNSIDLLRANRPGGILYPGEEIGYIQYANGSTWKLYYKAIAD